MDYRKKYLENAIIIELIGNSLELQEIDGFKNIFFKSAEENLHYIILNMESIEKIDSSGIGIFISFWKTFQDKNTLLFHSLHPHIEKVFHSTNLDKIFKIYKNEEDVIKSLK